MNTYNIKVVTSNIRGSGTNAKVYIELIGKHDRSGVIFLEKSSTHSDKFEQGKTDSFDIKCKNVGNLVKIRIGHDNKGLSPGWHLKEVIIESLSDGRTWLCECNNWLAKDEGDRKIERELSAIEIKSDRSMYSSKPEKIMDSPRFKNKYDRFSFSEKSSYKIYVTTSSINSAGTNSNVYIQLFGRLSSTDKIPLKTSTTNKNPFEKGKTDCFEIDTLDIGDIKKIRIGHDNKGLSSGWHLKEVIIESLLDGRRWLCECDNWLAKGEGDGKIERELPAIEMRPDMMNNALNNKHKQDYNRFSEKCPYKVFVMTSDIHNAGTNANVFIQLFGRNSNTDKIQLKNSKMNKNPFEKGNTDCFEFEALDVGEIKKIRIGHDNKGIRPGWHLKEVIIETMLDGRRWLCECNNWFAKDEGDKKIERELLAAEMKPDKLKNKLFGRCLYKIYVATSNIHSAGTNSNVFIEIFGKHSKTDKIVLKSSNLHKNPFEKGNTDYFEIESDDVGDIKKIRIGHDNKGLAPGWHLKEVAIHKEDGQTWLFPCNEWFDKKEGDGQIERELFPVEEKDKHHNDLRQGTYIVDVYTGDVSKGGTDANVYLTLFGERGESDEIHLRESETHRDMFERDHMDRFYVELDQDEEIGELIAIRIRHDNTGRQPEWFLDRVEILESDTKNKYLFECKKWLALKKYDSKIDRIIKEKKQLEKENAAIKDTKIKKIRPKKQYYIKFYTKDKKKNYPIEDLHLNLKLFGDRYQSKFFKSLKSITHETKFCPNQIDLCVVECEEDLGTIYAIEMRLKSIVEDIYSTVGLEKIEVQVDDMKYYFFFDRFITVSKDANRMRIILLEQNAQFL